MKNVYIILIITFLLGSRTVLSGASGCNKVPSPELNQDEFIQKVNQSSLEMFFKAVKKYKKGEITKDKLIEVALSVDKMNDVTEKNKPIPPSTSTDKTESSIKEALEKYAGSVLPEKKINGESTTLKCPDHREYTELSIYKNQKNKSGGYLGTICILRKFVKVDGNGEESVTKDNEVVLDGKDARDCPAGYIPSIRDFKQFCDPVIKIIGPGEFDCGTSYVPAKRKKDGKWDCFSPVDGKPSPFSLSKTEGLDSDDACFDKYIKRESCNDLAGKHGIDSLAINGYTSLKKNTCTGEVSYTGGCTIEKKCIDYDQEPVNCEQYAGQYGIPITHKLGKANYSKNQCTDKIIYRGGCYEDKKCEDLKQESVACSQYAGQFGIPQDHKIGRAQWTKNSCTGAIKYKGGCSEEADLCKEVNQEPVECSQYAGTYEIPETHKKGKAKWSKNPCSGEIKYKGGCTIP